MLGTNFQFQNVLPKAVYLGAVLVGTLGGLSSGEVLAASCDTRGGLAYLGNVKGSTRSVWLSGTSAGSFNLEAAQGNHVGCFLITSCRTDCRMLDLSASFRISRSLMAGPM